MKATRGEETARRPARPAVVAFLVLWLILWTTCFLAVAWALTSGAAATGRTPLAVWLVICAGGWLVGVVLLRRALRGRPPRRVSGNRRLPRDIGKEGPGGDSQGGPGDGDGD
ncbi:hypothetical protein G5B40_16240 [Pikeienuella piscinae]|uniref:Uncharacterized protein n=1 Tax=Pikeienuella piscinae TaxID=2748098 RepID=A0A7L5C4I4_9RHOB|nr:hypothetical protein [Pikeienuella piscinae]QIE56849.1 hypothetical protein G5B40_16240 [Pikeienuella piscinae]